MSEYSKLGYKNINSQDSIAKGERFGSDVPSGDKLVHGDFINHKKVGNWGMPGQTLQHMKTMEEFLKSGEIASREVKS